MEEDKSLTNIVTDEFGKIIHKIRKEKKLTQKELAELINVSDRTISKWENGQSVPDLICVKNICKALGISPSSIVLDKKTKKEHINDFQHKLKNFFNPKCILNIIFIVLFLLLFIFYINNRNTVTIYKLKMASDDIFINDGYYIRTKYKNILVIDDIRLNKENNYNTINIELYTYINGDKKVIYERNSLENIYIDDFEDYSPRLAKDIVDSISNSLYISITINNDIQYEGTFSIIKEFQNNKVIKEKTKVNNNNEKVASVFKEKNTNDKLIELGYTYDDYDKCYKIDIKGKIIGIDVNNQELSMVIKNKKIYVYYYYDKDYVSYRDNKDKDNIVYFVHYTDQRTDRCEQGNCKNHYDEIDKILSIYQEIKEIL